MKYRTAFHLAQTFLDTRAGVVGHLISTRLYAAHVNLHGPFDHDPVIGGAMHQVGSIGTGYKRLGRHAAGVDAGPAKELSFDVGHCLAGAGQLAGQRRAGLAGPDDDRVESVHRRATPIAL